MSNDLCEELIVEIFSRLPTKSLLRIRSLSKSLRVHIDSPDFIRLHISRSPKKFTIKHKVRDKYMYTLHSEAQLSSYAGITPVEYPFGDFTKNVGSCNGIVCLYDRALDVIHLWNPSIRRNVTLHDLPSHADHNCYRHWFGFYPVNDDYKILRIAEAGTFVYTMKTKTWRKITSPGPPFVQVKSYQCLFNGALYMVAYGYSDHYYYYIVRFDLSSEVFSAIELPPELRFLDCREMTIVKGCLAVISGYGYSSRIWVRNTAAASWSSVALEFGDPGYVRYLRSDHGDLLYSDYSQGILVYNSETEAQSRLAKLGDPNSSYIINMITCIESLELLDIGTSCDVITRKKSSKRKRA